MDFYYEFFDGGALDPLWRMSWKQYLHRWGRTHWASAEAIGEDTQSLRDTIAFFVRPEPAADEVERILSSETIRWAIKHSEPQFG